MALQHFYSRVPARVSMFNRSDGFDTFACSEGLSPEQMERELSLFYDIKMTAKEAELVRDNALPPVYCQYTAKSGAMVQACMSFLPLDYTGERSSYLAHSLVLTEEEAHTLLHDPSREFFVSSAFRKNLDGVDLTSAEAKPDKHYPQYTVSSGTEVDLRAFAEKYDAGMLKRLIYCLLQILCGKSKNVYITLPVAVSALSDTALAFMNAVLQIIPYHMRGALSFATYIGDTIRYPSVKVKFMPATLPDVPSAKGITLHFGTKLTIGLVDAQVADSAFLVDFFYALFSNDAIRRDFLVFIDSVAKNDSVKINNTKTLSDLVFIFEQCSGYYREAAVLPTDEKVLDYITVYEKYRNALPEEYRTVALKCLNRYPNKHQQIPLNIFKKVSKIYPTENFTSRRTVMNIVLELIHTDIMRDKLFTFIKSNYDDEPEDIRAIINSDLCRVYYGGFLQVPIIDFFLVHYPTEPIETQNMILEKMILTVRTEAVQKKIVDFFDADYSAMTKEQKEKLYAMIAEMLPEGDALAGNLIAIVDGHIGDETDEVRAAFSGKLLTLVENDARRKEPRLMKVLLTTDGFCMDVVMGKLFSEWSGRKLFTDYVDTVWKQPFVKRIRTIIHIFEKVPQMDAEVFETMLAEMKNCGEVNNHAQLPLEDVLALEEEVRTKLGTKENTPSGKCGAFLIRTSFEPVVRSLFLLVFTGKPRPENYDALYAYAEQNPEIKSSAEYDAMRRFAEILSAVQAGNMKKATEGCAEFPEKQRATAGELLRIKELNGEAASAIKSADRLTLTFLLDFMKDGTFRILQNWKAFDDAKSVDEEKRQDYEFSQAEVLFDVLSALFDSALPPTTREPMCSEKSELIPIVNDLVNRYGKKGQKRLLDSVKQNKERSEVFTASVCKYINAAKAESTGFFAKLFSKK